MARPAEDTTTPIFFIGMRTSHTVMLCYVMLCYVMLCYVMLCYVMLCYVMLCFVLFCFVLFCFVMFCFVMLCYVMFEGFFVISPVRGPMNSLQLYANCFGDILCKHIPASIWVYQVLPVKLYVIGI